MRLWIFLGLWLLALAAPAQPEETIIPGSRATGAGSGVLDALSGLSGPASGEPELLDPEEAFILSLTAPAPDRLVARWTIAEGYYLYRDRLSLTVEDQGATVAGLEFSTGKFKDDEFFGRMEVFHDQATLTARLERPDPTVREITVKVGYQGCAEVGVCYPPQVETVPVVLPVLAAATAQAAPAPTPPVETAPPPVPAASEQDLISRLLLEQRFWALPAFFGFGLLLAFTPCVFPMIPILSGLIAGQGESLTQWRAFSLSLVYVLAMAMTYTFAGVLAGLLGANIQVWFQNPWVLVTFSGLFVALALSMFGLFELQLPAHWQGRMAELSNRQSGGSFLGVGIMGLLSALIVGPCVAPPLIGILAVIAASGDVFLGGTALFTMSLGMGAPLVLIGTSAGRLLPRAGHWMERVKAVFGVLLLGVAIWMLERILPAGVTMLSWAMLAIVSATFMGALQSLERGAAGWRVLVKGLGVVLLAYGLLLLVGMAAGGRDPLQPLQGTFLARDGTAARHPVSFQAIKGPQGLGQALAAAEGRPVMLDFYADWCVSCKEMERYTFADPQVQGAMERFRLLQTDVTANDEADRALLRQFNLIGPPAILFFDAQGRELPAWRVVGFVPAERFRDHLQGFMSLSL